MVRRASLDGKKRVALVTGAAAGLGASFTERLAREGCDLVLVDRQEDKLRARAREIASRYGVRAHVIVKDLTAPRAALDIKAECEREGLRVDILVNNAGFHLNKFLHQLPWEAIRDNIQLLLGVVVELTHALVPSMIERGWGRVINVASLSGFMPGGVRLATYNSTKAFLIPFSEALGFELEGTGVEVTVVCPGFMRTDIFESSGVQDVRDSVPSFMWLEPDQVADEALRASLSHVPLRVSGIPNRLIATAAKFAPRKLLRERTRILHRKAHTEIAASGEAARAEGGKRTALVTGASSGIGASMAEVFAAHGHDVMLVARRRDRIEARARELEQRHKVRAVAIAQDLTDPKAPEAIFDACARAGAHVDVLVNNAGYPFTKLLHQMTWEELQAALEISVRSIAHLTHLFLPPMIERGFGKVINVASMAAFEPGSYRSSLYSSGKAFVVAFTESIAAELEATGVTATAVCPGFTKTEWVEKNGLKNASFPPALWMESDRVAEIAFRDAMRGVPVSIISTPVLRAISTAFQIAPRRMIGRFLSSKRQQSMT